MVAPSNSTVSGEEMRQSIAKVVQVVGLQLSLVGKSGKKVVSGTQEASQ